MNEEAQCFLLELKKALEEDPNRAEIIAEYRLHVEEMLVEITENDADVYNLLVTRLGSPEELAELWKDEKSVTPKKMQRLFVFINIALFAGGVLFTIGYNVLGWRWLEVIWESLTESTTIIMLIYLFFWGLLGYEIGKALGARGRKVLTRTFIIGIIPNLLLMYLIVFRLIPYEWFDPLLDRSFILLSILCTVALYPISLLGYHWGRRASV